MIIFVTFNLSSSKAFNLVWSKILSFGNGLRRRVVSAVDCLIQVVSNTRFTVSLGLQKLVTQPYTEIKYLQ